MAWEAAMGWGRRGGAWCLVAVAALVGCEPMAPTGRPFEPVAVTPPSRGAGPSGSPTVSPGVSPRPNGAPDPFGDDRAAHDLVAPGDAGAARTVLAPDGSVLELPHDAAPASAGASATPGATTPTLVWDPAATLPEQAFGVQLVAVIPDRFPPRAVLALPTGEEVVVTPGAMVPAHGIVVLAIGQNGVRVAHVSPSGYQAKVVTETISVLSPKEAPPVVP